MQENYKKEARHTSIQLVDISSEIAFLSLSCFVIRRYFLNFCMCLKTYSRAKSCVCILPSIKDQILVKNKSLKIRMLFQI